jgi:hypothetical protein
MDPRRTPEGIGSARDDRLIELVARKIISFAKLGERDPERLCYRAVKSFKDDAAA